MWDRTNKVLLTIFVVLLIFAALITDIHAQGGGYCTAYYITYYDYGCRCYITAKIWRCTGWQQPRRSSGSGYNYYRYRRWY